MGLNGTLPRMRRFRTLPPGQPHGWTPYAWLFYLSTFFIEPVIRTMHGRAGVLYWTATALGTAVFLVAYFRTYWVRGLRLLPYVAILTLLAIVFAPVNTGAPVFFVYAAGAAANLDRPRDAWIAVLTIAAIGALTAFVVSAPVFGWVLGSMVTLVIGSVNIHFAAEQRSQGRLRLAQAEIEHLAAVAERERIARDLHDVLGHTLSLIVLKAELAQRVASRDAARAAAEMKDVEDVARRTLQEVREAIRGYRATLADELARAESMLRAAGIEARLDLDEAPLPQTVDEVLALALREAITNVVRHSGASWCHAALERRPGEVALVVRDDGRGLKGREGLGLRGMRERVEGFGGSVDVDAAHQYPGHGLALRISMPVGRQDTIQPQERDVVG